MKLVHVATGDLFRQALERGGDLAEQAKSYMEKGKLVPDELTVRMVLERLEAPDCEAGVLLDGFPRNLKQAEALDKALAGENKAIDKVAYIKVSEEEVLRRLSGRLVCRKCHKPYHVTDSPPELEGKCDACGGELYRRADDNEVTIKKRLDVYFNETAPLVEYYSAAGKLVEIDGVGDAEGISASLMAALGKELKPDEYNN